MHLIRISMQIVTFGEVFENFSREVGAFPGATAPGNASESCWEQICHTDSTEFALRTPHARRSDANFLILEAADPPRTTECYDKVQNTIVIYKGLQ